MALNLRRDILFSGIVSGYVLRLKVVGNWMVFHLVVSVCTTNRRQMWKVGSWRVGTPSFAAKPRRGKDRLREDSCMCGIKLWNRKADKLNFLMKQEAVTSWRYLFLTLLTWQNSIHKSVTEIIFSTLEYSKYTFYIDMIIYYINFS